MLGIVLMAAAFATELEKDSSSGNTGEGLGGGWGEPSNIINGEDAAAADYPMAGALLIDATLDFGSDGQYPMQMMLCSSTLIAPDVVMLAGHCVDEETLTYGYGSLENLHFYWTRAADLTEWNGMQYDPDLPDDAVEASDWVKNPGYGGEFEIGLAQNDDIALLFLSEPVTDVPFAYLPTADEATQLEEELEVVIVGWGQQGADQNAPYAEKQQGVSHIAELGPTEMKIGEEVGDVRKCHGDSGGPTFLEVTTTLSESLRVIGVTSHAYDMSDCTQTGGVDTRVDAYLEWIDEELTSRCEDGTRVWCEQAGIPSVEDVGHEDASEDGDDETQKKACGCFTPAGGAAPLLILGALAALTRRRRTALT